MHHVRFAGGKGAADLDCEVVSEPGDRPGGARILLGDGGTVGVTKTKPLDVGHPHHTTPAWLIAGALALAWGGPAHAAPTETSSVAYEVLVEGESDLPETPDPSATTTRVSGARLSRAAARGEGLGRLVDQIAGARVLDLGGPGGQRQLTLRGGAPSQALVVVDGIPLRTPFATGFDLGLVHPELLRSVEVVRGGQGAAWGDGALTGALVLRTRDAGAQTFGAATVAVGSFDTARISAVVRSPVLSAAATYEQTDGDFGYTSELVALPSVDRTRDNNDSRRATLSLSTGFDVAGGRLELRGGGAVREAGSAGLADSPGESAVARERSHHGRVHLGWTRDLDWAQGGAVRLSAFATRFGVGFRDPANEIESELSLTSLGSDAALELGLWQDHWLRLVLSGSGEWVSGAEYPNRGRLSVGLSDEWAIGTVLIFGGLRAEVVGGQSLAVLPRLGARWDLTSRWFASAAIGRSQRTPTLDELYHPEGNAYSGNPDLVAERAWEAELGVGWEGPHTSWRAAGFARRIDDTILFLNRNAFLVRPENVGAADAVGGELEGAAQARLGSVVLRGDAQASLLLSRLRATDARLPTQPVFSGAVDLTARRGWLELDSAVRVVGPTFVQLRPSANNRVPAYLRWDAGIRVHWQDKLQVGFEVLNLLGDRTLMSVNRLPLPGRTFFVSVRVASGAEGEDS